MTLRLLPQHTIPLCNESARQELCGPPSSSSLRDPSSSPSQYPWSSTAPNGNHTKSSYTRTAFVDAAMPTPRGLTSSQQHKLHYQRHTALVEKFANGVYKITALSLVISYPPLAAATHMFIYQSLKDPSKFVVIAVLVCCGN